MVGVSDDSGAASGTTVESEATTDVDSPVDATAVGRYLLWGALVVLVLLALVAVVGLYADVSRVIQVWVTREYRPVVSAAFNLSVLLVAAAGISVLLRQLEPERQV